MRSLVVTVAVAATALVSAGAGGTVPGAVDPVFAPSRVVDRTFACTLYRLPGGVGDLDVAISTAYHDRNSGWRAPAQIELASGVDTLDNKLVYVRSHAGTSYGGRTFPPGPYANTTRCVPAKRIPLSQRGLPGPPVRWSTGTQCRVRGRVVIRLRAVLRSPANWGMVQRPYAGARMDVLESAVAVRSERGRKPVVYGALTRSGGVQFFASPACE